MSYMKLPVIWPDLKIQRFDCHGCTECCRDLVVHLTPEDRRRIDEQNWAEKLDRPAYVRLGRAYVLNHGSDRACVFLTAEGRCRIHSDFGATEKPLACRMYPFTIDRHGNELRPGIRFDCPSVGANRGSPIEEHRPDVGRLARQWAALPANQRAAKGGIRLAENRVVTEGELSAVLRHFDRWLRADSLSVTRRLAGLLGVLDTLEAARLVAVREERLDELVGMLIDDLPNVLRERTAGHVVATTPRQIKLFRQAVFARVEHVTFEQGTASFLRRLSGRFDQLQRSRRLQSGRGPAPRLGDRGTARAIEQIEAMGASGDFDGAVCDELLTRYVRFRIAARSAFGPAYYDWSVIEGVRALVLSVAVVGWLTRYVAASADRTEYVHGDVTAALGMIDRTSGRSPILGTVSARLRLRYLREHDGLIQFLDRFAPVDAG